MWKTITVADAALKTLATRLELSGNRAALVCKLIRRRLLVSDMHEHHTALSSASNMHLSVCGFERST